MDMRKARVILVGAQAMLYYQADAEPACRAIIPEVTGGKLVGRKHKAAAWERETAQWVTVVDIVVSAGCPWLSVWVMVLQQLGS